MWLLVLNRIKAKLCYRRWAKLGELLVSWSLAALFGLVYHHHTYGHKVIHHYSSRSIKHRCACTHQSGALSIRLAKIEVSKDR